MILVLLHPLVTICATLNTEPTRTALTRSLCCSPSSARSLALANNYFTGDVPRAWTSLALLQFLDLSYNSLAGNLSETLTWSVPRGIKYELELHVALALANPPSSDSEDYHSRVVVRRGFAWCSESGLIVVCEQLDHPRLLQL